MRYIVDKRIYSDECISKAVYALADKYAISREWVSETEEALCSDSNKAEDAYIQDVIQSLNDYKLRTIIERETHDIRTILYVKAFEDCDDVSETDLD